MWLSISKDILKIGSVDPEITPTISQASPFYDISIDYFNNDIPHIIITIV